MIVTKKNARLSCVAALVFGSAALGAQQTTEPERGELNEICKISTLIGTQVMNRADMKIADVRDLVLAADGGVRYAVLGHGGVAGVGETYTAAPFDCLDIHHVNGKWAVNLSMSAEDLKKAPVIQSENYREFTDPQWIARVHEFFCPRAESQAQPEQGSHLAQREPRGIEPVLLATKIRGAKLKNAENEELGKVEDLLLNRTRHVVFAIIGRGGVLGVGETYMPVPWSKLNLSSDAKNAAVTVMINASKAHVEKAPLVKGDNYETLLAPGFAQEVRRYFQVTERGEQAGSER
jgi:PRC-barrel domain